MSQFDQGQAAARGAGTRSGRALGARPVGSASLDRATVSITAVARREARVHLMSWGFHSGGPLLASGRTREGSRMGSPEGTVTVL